MKRWIKLPRALDIGESYGKLSWSGGAAFNRRAISAFRSEPATMYETPLHSGLIPSDQTCRRADAIAKRRRPARTPGSCQACTSANCIDGGRQTQAALQAKPEGAGETLAGTV